MKQASLEDFAKGILKIKTKAEDCPYCGGRDVEEEKGGSYVCRKCHKRWRYD